MAALFLQWDEQIVATQAARACLMTQPRERSIRAATSSTFVAKSTGTWAVSTRVSMLVPLEYVLFDLM